ncbi:lytic transglycosylase domain-containing protein [Candidatus Pelagibacter communis]|uniref:lytic transglycosylase domain-containing protein n=1 Tax=Pelagibacter ubique TaxID=198252 RepID=UPI00094DCC53|nr:lytic transglycosylase domain-containing protein [Candidatus Pelagibacter ubique]
MLKKILFLGFAVSILIFSNNLFAEINSVVPLKKPVLSKEEIQKKISINILKPLKKPTKTKEIKIEEVIVKKELVLKEKKLSFKIPKKKPTVAGISSAMNIKISRYYSKRDFGLAKKAISEMQKSKWSSALKIAKKAKDKSIYNFIQWRHLLTSGNQASFFDYQVFLNKNSDYPRISRVKYLAEHKLSTESVSPKKIIKWFGENDPLSGYGKMILGESHILIGDKNKGTKLIKEGWVTADLSKNELKYFRKKYKKYLNADDYIKRADYLAWNGDRWDLRRLIRYLPKDYELLYNARHLLMSKGYGVDQAIANVPQKFKNDAGLNYDRLKWRRKKGRVDSSTEILLKIRNDKEYLVRPDKWWKEREIISRALLYKKKYEISYKISSNHGMTEGSEYAAAEWMSGWIALSFLNDPLTAKDHFKNFYENVSYPISLSRGAYWLGRTYEKIGEREQSNNWYREATKYLTTYYGQLAFLKLNPNGKFELEKDMEIDPKYRIQFFNKELVKISYLLDELKKDKYTKHILRHLANDNIAKGSEVLAAELATSINRYDFAIQVSKIASYQKRFHNKYNYPIISTPKYINKRKIPESALILSIIRQESEFDLEANSHAGAKGLMQLMPYTAKLVSKQAKLPYSKSRLTTDPEYNINLGSHYIAGLILQYDGAYPFAVAAYNAGPNRVKYWKKINKDPQKKQVDYVDWVELIKFRETRNYVQRVMENYNVYRYILEQRPVTMKNFFKDQPLF